MNDIWVIKLSSSGDLEWEKAIGGSGQDYGYDIIQTGDNGYLITGYTGSIDGDITSINGGLDYLLVKLDDLGNVEWTETYGGSGNDCANSLIRLADGNYLITGFSFSSDGDVSVNMGSSDIWVIKVDPLGNLLWEFSYGGSLEDYGVTMTLDSDGGILMFGGSDSPDGDLSTAYGWFDYWLFKIDDAGTILWESSYGGSWSDYASSIILLNSGHIMLAGHTESDDGVVVGHQGGTDYWLIKVADGGGLLNQLCLGGSSHDQLLSVVQDQDENILCFGRTFSTDGQVSAPIGEYDYWLSALDTNLNLLWEQSLGGSDSDFGSDLIETSTGAILLAGYSGSNDGDLDTNYGKKDFWIVKLDGTIGLSEEEIEVEPVPTLYPNPAFSGELIHLKSDQDLIFDELLVFDTQGRRQQVELVESDLNAITLTADLSPGIYTVHLLKNGARLQAFSLSVIP